MKTGYGKFYAVFIILLLTLLPRVFSLDAHWSSDETRWLRRSHAFVTAVQESRFNDTQQSYHPGVTTTWLGGMSLWLKYKQTLFFADSSIKTPLISVENLSRSRLSISIVVSCIIALSFLLIQQLQNTRIAILSGLLIAYDPIFLTQSRRLHTDALAAGFILLTVLFLLFYLARAQYLRSLIASGVCFGLACLSKSNALILGFCLPIFILLYPLNNSEYSSNKEVLSIDLIIVKIIRILLLFSTACLTIIFSWPVLWNIKIHLFANAIPFSPFLILTLLVTIGISSRILIHQSKSSTLYSHSQRTICILYIFSVLIPILIVLIFCSKQAPLLLKGIVRAIQTEHEVAHLFLDKIVNDPGWLFYPLMLSIKSAPLTLPLCLVGFVLLWQRRKESQYGRTYRIFVALSIVVLLFTVCMSAGAKKFSRYLLPVFPILDILAAIGLCMLITKITQASILRQVIVKLQSFSAKPSHSKKLGLSTHISQRTISKGVGVTVMGLAILIQVFPVLKLHPYYGTYYNPLWGLTDITNICTTGDASGLDVAADYLNQKSNAENLVVSVSPLAAEYFGYYFKGKSNPRDRGPELFVPDYEVAYIRDVQINLVNLDDIEGTLEHVIRLNCVDYVWIYKR